MKEKIIYEIKEVIGLYKVNEVFIYQCIEKQWITPCDCEKELLDKEDIARILLIKDLKEIFSVNDESIPVILHLIDQIHWLKSRLAHYMKAIKENE
ncbi:MAG: chaperone modulator CbpM [Spirochaetota bacterium]